MELIMSTMIPSDEARTVVVGVDYSTQSYEYLVFVPLSHYMVRSAIRTYICTCIYLVLEQELSDGFAVMGKADASFVL